MTTTADIFDAIKNNDLDRVRQLVGEDRALAAARNDQGQSAVLLARYHGRAEALDVLLAAGPALDIFEAAAVGHTARVRELIDANPALVNAYAADGFYPLGLAAFFGHLETARLLLERGADVDQVARNQMQVQPLHAALAGRHEAIARLLVEHGADVNAKQHGGYTPLHEAAQHGDLSLVELLLAHGADRSARLESGQTPAELAAEHGHTHVAERLRTAA